MALWDRRCVSFPQLGETEKQATCRQHKTTVTAKQTQRWLSCGVTKTGLSWIEDAEVGCHKAGTSSFRSGPSHILPSPSRERAALRAVGEFGEACSDDRRSSEKKEETKKTLIGAFRCVHDKDGALRACGVARGESLTSVPALHAENSQVHIPTPAQDRFSTTPPPPSPTPPPTAVCQQQQQQNSYRRATASPAHQRLSPRCLWLCPPCKRRARCTAGGSAGTPDSRACPDSPGRSSKRFTAREKSGRNHI